MAMEFVGAIIAARVLNVLVEESTGVEPPVGLDSTKKL
jgi:hypothetical protein